MFERCKPDYYWPSSIHIIHIPLHAAVGSGLVTLSLSEAESIKKKIK